MIDLPDEPASITIAYLERKRHGQPVEAAANYIDPHSGVLHSFDGANKYEAVGLARVDIMRRYGLRLVDRTEGTA